MRSGRLSGSGGFRLALAAAVAVLAGGAFFGARTVAGRDAEHRFGLHAAAVTNRVQRSLDRAVVVTGRLDAADLSSVDPDLLALGGLEGAALVRSDGSPGSTAVVVAGRQGGDSLLAVGNDLSRLGDAALVLAQARDRGTLLATPPLPAAGTGAAVLLVRPLYEGSPLTTVERRAGLRGFVIGELRPGRLVAGIAHDVLPDPATIHLADGSLALGPAPGSGADVEGYAVRKPVTLANQAWRLTFVPRHPPGHDATVPWALLAGGLLTAAAIAGIGRFVDHTRTAALREAAAPARELRSIAEIGPMLQESLDLGELLPTLAVKLADDFELDRVGLVLADSRGDAVEAFTMGSRSIALPHRVAELPPVPPEVPARTEFYLPLKRAGRTIGGLRLRPLRDLDTTQLRSLRAIADLLAATLGNAQLYLAEQEAVGRLRDLDRMKSDFVGTVSHELRTSVIAIAGFGNLLESRWDQLSDDQRHDFARRMNRNAASLQTLVEELLDFNRLERGTLTIRPECLDLSEVAAASADHLSSLLDSHVVELRLTPDVTAYADHGALERIIANLLSNAAQYTPEGTTITVETGTRSGRPYLSVADRGPGVSPDDREHIFDRFYRGANDAARRTRGTGIGLAIVRELVEHLGGRVAVEDVPGGGARFVVELVEEPTRGGADEGTP